MKGSVGTFHTFISYFVHSSFSHEFLRIKFVTSKHNQIHRIDLIQF